MHHRGSCFVRFIVLLLAIGAILSIGRGLYRSGFEQGFTQGMVFATTDGEAVRGPSALPPFYGASPMGGFGPSFPGGGLLALAFFTFFALMFMGAAGRRHRRRWAHAGHPDGHAGGHGDWSGHRCGGRHMHHKRSSQRSDDIGPEKQPEDIL